MTDFYHKKVIPFENYVSINFNYCDIDIILKALELLNYNIKNIYLMKEDNNSIREMLYKISILYNLILSSYTLHIDNELKKKEQEKPDKKITYYSTTMDLPTKIKKRKKEVILNYVS